MMVHRKIVHSMLQRSATFTSEHRMLWQYGTYMLRGASQMLEGQREH